MPETYRFLTLDQDLLSFVTTMMMTSRTYLGLHLVEADSFIGPSLMRRILNGGAHPDTQITMRNLGTGDIDLMRILTQQNLVVLRVQTKIRLQTGRPLA